MILLKGLITNSRYDIEEESRRQKPFLDLNDEVSSGCDETRCDGGGAQGTWGRSSLNVELKRPKAKEGAESGGRESQELN